MAVSYAKTMDTTNTMNTSLVINLNFEGYMITIVLSLSLPGDGLRWFRVRLPLMLHLLGEDAIEDVLVIPDLLSPSMPEGLIINVEVRFRRLALECRPGPCRCG